MSLARGREFLSIPGPTNVPDVVLAAMHRPAMDIYSADLLKVTESCLADLKKIFRTESGTTYAYVANGHAAWEAALTNVLSRGDKVLVLASGRFAVGWGDAGAMLGLDVEVLARSWHEAVDPAAVEARLKADVAHAIKAILVVQVDTATGVVNDIAAIRAAIDAAGHPALFMVDAIASIGCMPFEMDLWGIDVAVTASQKGLMMIPGLGFLAASPKARAAHATAGLRASYWDWTNRDQPEGYRKFCGTAPGHALFGQRAAFDLLFAEGLEAAWVRHRALAAAVQAAVEVWSRGGGIAFNVTEPAARAPSVTTVLTPGSDPERLRDFTRTQLGVILGSGLGELSGRAFRIAHMGYVNAPMVLGTLGAIEIGLAALAIPHGAGGVQAAVAALQDHFR
ncbi:aminotransferase class V-fold PLP-dependent enzyme [Siculibacillus lacustris]|uniref:Aminotransferase class V-fold PLP-dependent enzyme n=1 Tax=Siculibacillus lacustris TaxID=1549641 RepID=A0A4Q9VLP7_9HYPH|nr:aminotransferase class V-fold PLP-dependent enzyme [Siculibacillus lacustris]TBW36448.1 aminotransferase class V-fold PLP-dependent enzyme [Siculibacillus lacustris]